MSTEENKRLARQLYAGIDHGGWDAVADAGTDDFRCTFPGIPGTLDRAGMEQVVRMFTTALPDVTHEVEQQVAEGDWVVTRLRIRGTHRAELQGIPPTGRAVDFTSVNLMRYEEDRLAEMRVSFDQLELMTQLGVAPADHRGLVRAMYDAFNDRAFDRLPELVTEDYRSLTVPTGATLSGREGAGAYQTGWATAVPDSSVEITRLSAAGDTAVVEFVGRGTHLGPLQGPAGEIPASGRHVEIPFCEVHRLRDGRVAESTTYFDLATLLGQIGVLPSPAAAQHFDISGARIGTPAHP
jgi:steroid delta-isomerase-like uncharacterized protein